MLDKMFGLRPGDTVHLNQNGKTSLAEKAEDIAKKLEGQDNDFEIVAINQGKYIVASKVDPSIKLMMDRDQISMGKGRIFKNIAKVAAAVAATAGAIYGGRKLARGFKAARLHRDRSLRDYMAGRMKDVDAPDERMLNKFGQAVMHNGENVLASGEGLSKEEARKQFAIFKKAKQVQAASAGRRINVDQSPDDDSIGYEKVVNGAKNAVGDIGNSVGKFAKAAAIGAAMGPGKDWAMKQLVGAEDEEAMKPVGVTKLGEAVYQNNDGAYFKYDDSDQQVFLTEDEFEKLEKEE